MFCFFNTTTQILKVEKQAASIRTHDLSNMSLSPGLPSMYRKFFMREQSTLAAGSVTKVGDLLDFGQLFKAFGNN